MSDNLKYSYAYRPQTKGQTERTTHYLEDLLGAYVIEKGIIWDSYFPLIKFTYNNNFHSSIGITPLGDYVLLRFTPVTSVS